MAKRFSLGKLLERMDGHTCPKTMVTNTHEINDISVDGDADLVGVSGFIISLDGLTDRFNCSVEITDVTQKAALEAATPAVPVECTTTLLPDSETGFPTISLNPPVTADNVDTAAASDTQAAVDTGAAATA